MRTLEARHPDVTFDWEALRRTPMPPPSPEFWRERRRAEKAMKQFRAADELEASPHEGSAAVELSPQTDDAASETTDLSALSDLAAESEEEVTETVDEAGTLPGVEIMAPAAPQTANPGSGGRRRRRRRRGHRGRPGSNGAPGLAQEPAAKPFAASTDQDPEQSPRSEIDHEPEHH